MQIFAEFWYLYKRLQITIIPNHEFWDIIASIVTLDILHNDFETMTASFFKTGDKLIDEI